MKKNNCLGAKILIFILLFFIISIGLLKFVDKLEGSSDNFLSVLESLSTTADDISNIFDNDFYNLIDGNVEANIDTKISLSNAFDSAYNSYSEMLESSSFITNVKFDKSEYYLSSTLKASKNNLTYTIDYNENGNDNFLRSQKSAYKKNAIDILRFKNLNKNIYTIIIKEFINNFKNYESNYEAMTLNNNTQINNINYYAEVKSISLSGETVIDLLKETISILSKRDGVYRYLKYKYVLDNATQVELLDKIIGKYGIKSDNRYVINFFINTANDSLIRFTFGENAKTPLISFNILKNYFEFKNLNSTYIYKGVSSYFTWEIINDSKKTTWTYKKEKDTIIGSLSVYNGDVEKYHFDYTCDVIKTNENTTSLSLIISLYPTEIKKGMKVELNSSILVKNGVDIVKNEITSVDATSKKTYKETIDEFLKEMNDYLNVTIIQEEEL